jgi:4-amino-4-deoxy-L-arabinose transferase-like glycosyltransferase
VPRTLRWAWALWLTLLVVACAEWALSPEVQDDLLAARGPEIVFDVVLPQDTTVVIGEAVQFCWFGQFKDGRVAMRSRDRAACQTTYVLTFPDSVRAVNKKQQAVADAAVIEWGIESFVPPLAPLTQS